MNENELFDLFYNFCPLGGLVEPKSSVSVSSAFDGMETWGKFG